MNYCGLICEYNPFHTGHLYQLSEIKKLLPDSAVVCVMSGNFVQRAEPAVVDKLIRTKLSLDGGADAVIQIPTAYTLCGGEKFAAAAIAILGQIKNLKHLAFGCETSNFELLKKIAKIRAAESELFKNALHRFSKDGLPYPKALCKATVAVTDSLGIKSSECAAILDKPNNILAIEYLKIIYKNNYDIEPIFICREDNYNSKTVSGKFTSATAIRMALTSNETNNICDYLPYSSQLLKDNLIDYKLYDELLLFSLRRAGASKLSLLADCAEGIENRLYENSLKYTDINAALEQTKTKRYTYARLKRIAAQNIFDITKDMVSRFPYPYGKLLGIKKQLKPRLSDFGRHLIIKYHDTLGITDQFLQKIIEIDCLADDIHALLCHRPAGAFFAAKLIEI